MPASDRVLGAADLARRLVRDRARRGRDEPPELDLLRLARQP
jgi:hypothetical protein